jgi:hypothetical protein
MIPEWWLRRVGVANIKQSSEAFAVAVVEVSDGGLSRIQGLRRDEEWGRRAVDGVGVRRCRVFFGNGAWAGAGARVGEVRLSLPGMGGAESWEGVGAVLFPLASAGVLGEETSPRFKDDLSEFVEFTGQLSETIAASLSIRFGDNYI